MYATVTSKGQVTIPKPLRDRLGISEGVKLEFREEQGRLIVERVVVDDPVAAVYGLFRGGHSTDELLQSLRGEE